jgi:hypothetical protein
MAFNASEAYGNRYMLEEAKDKGCWTNLAVCSLDPLSDSSENYS